MENDPVEIHARLPAMASIIDASACVAAMCLLMLTGCYSMQALSGGAGILARRTSIAKVLAREDLSPDERHKLELSQQIVDFAINEMKLPDNGSYRTFVRIDRPYVVWNVVAAPELSVQPLHWCFPVAGCVSYRGYRRLVDAVEELADFV